MSGRAKMGLLVKSFCRDLILKVEEAESGFGFLGDGVVGGRRAGSSAAVVIAEELIDVKFRKFGGSVTSQMIVLKIEGVG